MHGITARYLPYGGPVRIEEDTSTLIPLVDGEQYFAAIRQEIGRTSNAGDLIYILGWRIESDFRFSTQPDDVSELGMVLALKAAAGVDVRIIMSAKWQLLYLLESRTDKELRAERNSNLDNQLDRYGQQGNPSHADKLRSIKVGKNTPLNARVLLDHSGELFGVHHQKMVIVQRAGSAVGFLGGIDFLYDRFDSTRHDETLPRLNPARPGKRINYYWHDAGARVEGPAVNGLFYYFAARWLYCASDLTDRSFKLKDGQQIASLNPRIEQTGLRAKGQATPLASSSKALPGVIVVANFPERDVRGASPIQHDQHRMFAKPAIHTTGDLYRKAIAAARKFIYVEDQYFGAPSLDAALREAVKRDVKIIVVTGAWDDDAGQPVSLQFSSPFLKSLGDLFAMRLVKSTIIHSKVMIIDDEFVAIGSTNFADRSLIEAEDKGDGDGMRDLLKAMSQGWGTDSELTAAAVDDRKTDWNVAMRLRVQLWAEHLRVDLGDQRIWRELSNLNTALSVFNASWGKPITFSSPNSRLVPVTISA
jgi:phosphatidylserine/phosphatidylglycerophosphate/cardiolipin synthase-like enzyme